MEIFEGGGDVRAKLFANINNDKFCKYMLTAEVDFAIKCAIRQKNAVINIFCYQFLIC